MLSFPLSLTFLYGCMILLIEAQNCINETFVIAYNKSVPILQQNLSTSAYYSYGFYFRWTQRYPYPIFLLNESLILARLEGKGSGLINQTILSSFFKQQKFLFSSDGQDQNGSSIYFTTIEGVWGYLYCGYSEKDQNAIFNIKLGSEDMQYISKSQNGLNLTNQDFVFIVGGTYVSYFYCFKQTFKSFNGVVTNVFISTQSDGYKNQITYINQINITLNNLQTNDCNCSQNVSKIQLSNSNQTSYDSLQSYVAKTSDQDNISLGMPVFSNLYSICGWFKIDQSEMQNDKWYSIYRVTINPFTTNEGIKINTDLNSLGDRVLQTFLKPNVFLIHRATYTLNNSIYNSTANLDFSSYVLNSSWIFLYQGYDRTKRQLRNYISFNLDDNFKDEINSNIDHYVTTQFYVSVGMDPFHKDSLQMKIKYIAFNICDGQQFNGIQFNQNYKQTLWYVTGNYSSEQYDCSGCLTTRPNQTQGLVNFTSFCSSNQAQSTTISNTTSNSTISNSTLSNTTISNTTSNSTISNTTISNTTSNSTLSNTTISNTTSNSTISNSTISNKTNITLPAQISSNYSSNVSSSNKQSQNSNPSAPSNQSNNQASSNISQQQQTNATHRQRDNIYEIDPKNNFLRKYFNLSLLCDRPYVSNSLQILKSLGILSTFSNLYQPLSQMLIINSQVSPLTYQALSFFGNLTFPRRVPQQNYTSKNTTDSAKLFFSIPETEIYEPFNYEDRYQRVFLSPVFILTNHLQIIVLILIALIWIAKAKFDKCEMDQIIFYEYQIKSSFIQNCFDTILDGSYITFFGSMILCFKYSREMMTNKYSIYLTQSSILNIISYLLSISFAIFFIWIKFQYIMQCRNFYKMKYDTNKLIQIDHQNLDKQILKQHEQCLDQINLKSKITLYYPLISALKKTIISLVLLLLYDYQVVQIMIIIVLQITVLIFKIIVRVYDQLWYHVLNIINEIFLTIIYIMILIEIKRYQLAQLQSDDEELERQNTQAWQAQGQITLLTIIISLFFSVLTSSINILNKIFKAIKTMIINKRRIIQAKKFQNEAQSAKLETPNQGDEKIHEQELQVFYSIIHTSK